MITRQQKIQKILYLHAKWGYEKNLNKQFKIKEITNFTSIKKHLS